jgi:hypothetical protein
MAHNPIPPIENRVASVAFKRIEGVNAAISIRKPTINKKMAVHIFHDCPERPIYELENIECAKNC